MKSIHLCFRIHHCLNLKRYRFFEIGNDHYYYDDFANEAEVRGAAEQCYLPANQLMLEMIRNSNKKFKVSFSISGEALEQFEQYAPEVIESFQELAKTGCVEFLATTYAHSLAAIHDLEEYSFQLRTQSAKIETLFGVKPTICANNALMYSDDMAFTIHKLGFKAAVIEDGKHVMGWRSAHYVYQSAAQSKLKLLVRDSKLSDDINFRFSQWSWNEYPLTAEKFIGWIADSPAEEKQYVLFMGYEALGILNSASSGIFDFFRALPYHALERDILFATMSDALVKQTGLSALSVPYPMSWSDEEKDMSAWCGNELQQEAQQKLYGMSQRVRLCSDRWLKSDWLRLQDANHFKYMSTKHYSNGKVEARPTPYDSPYDAFMNYMNVLSDFMARVEAQYPTSIENEELNALLKTIQNQEQEIAELEEQVKKLKSRKSTKESKV